MCCTGSRSKKARQGVVIADRLPRQRLVSVANDPKWTPARKATHAAAGRLLAPVRFASKENPKVGRRTGRESGESR
jgi:hypothetical protein